MDVTNVNETTQRVEVDEGIIVMLDALGIKNLNNQDAQDFLDSRDVLLETFEEETIEHLRTHVAPTVRGTLELEPEDLGVETEDELEEQIQRALQPEVLTFGDTIIFAAHTEFLDPSFYWTFSLHLSHLMGVAFANQLLIRGAMSTGPFLIEGHPGGVGLPDADTVLGPAVVDAAQWYEQPANPGIICTPTCGLQIDLLAEIQDRTDFPFRFGYVNREVNLKNGQEDLWVVPWPVAYNWKSLDEGEGEERGRHPREIFIDELRAFSIKKGTKQKYEGIKKFFDEYFDEHLETV